MKDLTKQAIELLKKYLDTAEPTPEQSTKAHVALTILREHFYSTNKE